MIGVIEIGGTKTIFGVFNDNHLLIDRLQIPTGIPEDFSINLEHYFSEHPVERIGIAAFGPLCLDPSSEKYGNILNTPKKGWSGFALRKIVEKKTCAEAFIDTDVNCACLGEKYYGNYSNFNDLAYVTIGTGIGVGVLIGGKPLHGILHPEMGHILARPEIGDQFKGCCPFHNCCIEGMASGKALELRSGRKGEELSPDDPVWSFESKYIAQLVYSIMISLSPQRIILGGGVMTSKGLLDKIKKDVLSLNNGYYHLGNDITFDDYLCRPSLDGNQALYGAYALTHFHDF